MFSFKPSIPGLILAEAGCGGGAENCFCRPAVNFVNGFGVSHLIYCLHCPLLLRGRGEGGAGLVTAASSSHVMTHAGKHDQLSVRKAL